MATLEEFKKSRVARCVRATITYADTTAVRIFTLPRGARIYTWMIHVPTALVTGTTTFTVGTKASAAYFISAMTAAATGTYMPDTESAVPGHTTTALTEVYATVGASNTAGTIIIDCVFGLDVERSIR